MISQTALVLFCCFCCSAVFYLAAALVKGRIAGVEILAVKLILRYTQGVGETVNMKYLGSRKTNENLYTQTGSDKSYKMIIILKSITIFIVIYHDINK